MVPGLMGGEGEATIRWASGLGDNVSRFHFLLKSASEMLFLEAPPIRTSTSTIMPSSSFIVYSCVLSVHSNAL